MFIPQVGELINNRYRVTNIIRLYNEIIMFEVEHISTKQVFTIKIVDLYTSPLEIISMMVNEVRILCSIDHPLFVRFIESFIDTEKMILCVVYSYENSKNFNEIMYRLTSNKETLSDETLKDYIVQLCVIGCVLDRYRIEMAEMDPKNLLVSDKGQVMIGSCLKFFPPNTEISNLKELRTENVT